MCRDETKQAFLFLNAFENEDEVLTQGEIRRRMELDSQRLFGTSKFLNVPEFFDELLRSAIQERSVFALGGGSYKISRLGVDNRDTFFYGYIQPSMGVERRFEPKEM